jgi:hypothetical protein
METKNRWVAVVRERVHVKRNKEEKTPAADAGVFLLAAYQ